MNPITFDRHTYWLDGKPLYLLSGEFHYFRVPRADWRRRMRLFKEAGGNCLATYVPWLLHEPREGIFDFSSQPWLDLEGFLVTAREEGLHVIARPGPYQYSELIYHGLPGWLIETYPEVLALNAEGKPFGYGSVSYTHPSFLLKARRWFDAVCPILARHTVSNGGAIAFTQIDNEMVGIHEWFGSLDYHPVSMGFGREDGAYPAYLARRYGSLQAANRAYGANFASLAGARPWLAQGEIESLRAQKDYFDFYLSTVADYAQTLVSWIRANGIDTPIVHNSANPGMNADFEQVAARLGDQFLLGSDHYYSLDQTWPQNNPTPQYAARAFVSLEMLRLMGYPPSVFEMPGGSASNWPPITPSDALACYLANLAYGMKGSNYYIFTGGPNPPGAGTTTDRYDYDASISAEGEVRPLYAAQKAFGAAAHAHPELLTGERVSDVRFGLDFEMARSPSYWKHAPGLPVSGPGAWDFLRRGLLTTSLCASLSPRFVNLNASDLTADTTTPLVVACAASMPRGIQRRLVDFLRAGGKALFAPILPTLDENFEPCTLLADFLGVPPLLPNPRGVAHPKVMQVSNVLGRLYFPQPTPAGMTVVGVDEMSGLPFAFQKGFETGGQAVVLGLEWTHAMREHERMLRALLERLGLEQAVACSNPNLWATAYPRGAGFTVFVLNLFTAPFEGEVTVGERSTGARAFAPMSVEVLEI